MKEIVIRIIAILVMIFTESSAQSYEPKLFAGSFNRIQWNLPGDGPNFYVTIGGFSTSANLSFDREYIEFELPHDARLGRQNMIIGNIENQVAYSIPVIVYYPARSAILISDNIIEAKSIEKSLRNDGFGVEGLERNKYTFDEIVNSNELQSLNYENQPIEYERLNGSGSICGKYMYRITQIKPDQFINLAKVSDLSKDTTVDPTGATIPSQSSLSEPRLNLSYNRESIRSFNNEQLKFINIANSDGERVAFAKKYRGAGVNIYVVDTAQSQTQDNFTSYISMNFDKNVTVAYKLDGHGQAIAEIINLVAPDASIKFKNVCNYNYCETGNIVKALCEIQSYIAKYSGTNIINFSLGSKFDTPAINGAIEDLRNSGAAVVVSFGNKDSCQRDGFPQICHQNPADFFSNMQIPGIYTVAAIIKNMNSSRPSYAAFNRQNSGQLSYPNRPPDLLAPGLYFLQKGFGDSRLQPRAGASYATGFASGMLALYANCIHDVKKDMRIDWPSASVLTGDLSKSMNISQIIAACRK